MLDEKSAIQSKLNYKTYRFSYNCENPVEDVEIVQWDYKDFFINCLDKADYNKPFYGNDNKIIGYVCDYSLEN